MKGKRTYSRKPKGKDAKQDKKIKVLEKKIKRIEPETKHITSNVNSLSTLVAVSNDWAFTPIVINALGQGTGSTQRVGSAFRPTSLELNYQINTVSDCGSYFVRVLLIREYTALGSNVSWPQVFQGSANLSVINVRNQDTRNPARYHILYDKIHYLGGVSTSTASDFLFVAPPVSNVVGRIKKKLNFITDASRGTSASVGDIDTNSLAFCVFTNQTTANAVTFLYAFDMGFIDS